MISATVFAGVCASTINVNAGKRATSALAPHTMTDIVFNATDTVAVSAISHASTAIAATAVP